MELSGFYGAGSAGGGGGDTDTSSLSNGETGGLKTGASSPYPQCTRPSLPALKFHNHFPPDSLTSNANIHENNKSSSNKDSLLMQVQQDLQGTVLQGVPSMVPAQQQQQQPQPPPPPPPVINRLHMQQQQQHHHMRQNSQSEAEERVMLYVRQESEEVYTPLHVAPPSVQGLLNAVREIFIYLLIVY